MALYKCDCKKEEKQIGKSTIVLRDSKWVTKEALCSCGKYMTAEPEDGFPQLKRTESSLSKKQIGDKLWDEAKEAIVGDRGVNESF